MITILGLQIGYLLSGAFMVENVFAWPGIGRFSVQALAWRDYPIIQGIVMITALIFLTINLLVDLLYVASIRGFESGECLMQRHRLTRLTTSGDR